jgi:hypothetical protein
MADAHLDDGGWEWHYDDDSDATKAILTRVVQTGAGTEVTIPAILSGAVTLKTIKEDCFKDAEGAKITKVLGMPNTITSMGNSAFKDCVIMTSVVLSSGLTTIGEEAFRGCTLLASISFRGLVAPVTVGADWILGTAAGIRGHARPGSNFPAPAATFNGLTMGTNLSLTLIATGNADAVTTWDSGTAAAASDNLILTGAFNLALNQALTYGNITLGAAYSGTATQGAVDFGYADFSMAGGTLSGSANWQICSGNWTKTGGTVSAWSNKIKMTGTGITITSNSPTSIAGIWITGSCVLGVSFQIGSGTTSPCIITGSLNIGVYDLFLYSAGSAVDISGTITGTTGLLHHGSGLVSGLTGSIACKVWFGYQGTTSTLARNLATTNSVEVRCVNQVALNTLVLAGYSLSATSITVGDTGVISSSVAGARIDSGDITVAANGTLTEANITQIKSSGNVDLSAGTYTPSAARWILTGLGKTLKLAAGHKLYDLITTGTSDIRLAANATVSNELVMASRINPLTYTLTHESPAKLYDQRRMHYEVPHEPMQIEQGRADMILGYLTGRANMER